APATAPPLPLPPPTKKESERRVSDVLKQIELPPNIPELGDLAPTASATPARQANTYKKTDPAAQKLSSRIRDLQVPDTLPNSSPGKGATAPSPTPVRPVISEDILERLRRPVEQLERLPQTPPSEPRE